MLCATWSELVRRYRNAVGEYNEAVQGLGTEPDAGFDRVWERVETARVHATAARSELLDHEHKHGCLVGRAPVVAQPGVALQPQA